MISLPVNVNWFWRPVALMNLLLMNLRGHLARNSRFGLLTALNWATQLCAISERAERALVRISSPFTLRALIVLYRLGSAVSVVYVVLHYLGRNAILLVVRNRMGLAAPAVVKPTPCVQLLGLRGNLMIISLFLVVLMV